MRRRFCAALLAASQSVVMVVGSYGKTTTTRAVRAGAGAAGESLVRSKPEYFGGSSLVDAAEAAWRRHVVIEAGIAAPGQMAHYAGILTSAHDRRDVAWP